MLSGWIRVAIGGKPVDVFEPPLALPFTLLYLHSESGDTPAVHPTLTAELKAKRLRCVAPHGNRSWWVDRICPEFDPELTGERYLIERVVPWIEATWRERRVVLSVAGVGMGGQGAVRLAFRHPERFPVAASIAGAFDFHERHGQGTQLDDMYSSREQCRQDTAILHIPPHGCPRIWFACSPRDEWYRGNDRLHEKLSAIGVEHTAELDAPQKEDVLIRSMLAFLLGEFERESRRLS